MLLVFIELVLNEMVLVLVLDAFLCSYSANQSANYRESLRSTIVIAAVQTAIEYEETQGDARTYASSTIIQDKPFSVPVIQASAVNKYDTNTESQVSK